MSNNNQLTTKPKHFLDEVEEEITNTVLTEDPKVNSKAKSVVGDDLEEEEFDENNKINDDNDLEEEVDQSDLLEEETDEELEEAETTESFNPFIQELVDSDIIDIPEDKEYSDDIEGFKELVEDNVTLKYQKYKESLVNPTSQKFIEYLEAGGSPDEYIEKVTSIPDYASITDLEDETTLKNLIGDHLHVLGYKQEDIEDQIAEYEEIGSLAKHGKKAQEYLVQYAEKEIAKITKEQQQAEAQRIKNLEAEEKQITDYIDSVPDVAGLPLTKKRREDLKNYIFKPVKKEGSKVYTQNLLEDSMETKVALAYFKMIKFDIGDIERKVETKQANKIQNLLKKKNDKLVGRTNTTTEESNNTAQLSSGWDFLNR